MLQINNVYIVCSLIVAVGTILYGLFKVARYLSHRNPVFTVSYVKPKLIVTCRHDAPMPKDVTVSFAGGGRPDCIYHTDPSLPVTFGEVGQGVIIRLFLIDSAQRKCGLEIRWRASSVFRRKRSEVHWVYLS